MPSLVFGFIAAFLLAAVPGKSAIAWLKRLGAKQNISTDAPTTHSAKQGTPTMGGLLILFALTVTTLLYYFQQMLSGGATVIRLLPLLFLTLAFGLIGFLDDFLSAKRGKNLGLKAREKLLCQFLAATGFVLWIAITTRGDEWPMDSTILLQAPGAPFARSIDLHLWYYPLAILFIVGLSNATNITDGLDGLSSGVTIAICFGIVTLISALGGPGLQFFTVALAGGLAGFLWWNAAPAKVFMGDTGSLALGAALAGVGLLGKCEIGLIIASLVCWAELFSVMIQVLVFKYRKKKHGLEYAKTHRVFRRAPLHHHFEEIGWPETQVVTRFWILSAICAAIALLFGRG